jgi:hypothetical protein
VEAQVKLAEERKGIMPPGYKLVCDSKGYYAWQTPEGFLRNYSDDVSTNADDVRLAAWRRYDWKQQSATNKYTPITTHESDWRVCE